MVDKFHCWYILLVFQAIKPCFDVTKVYITSRYNEIYKIPDITNEESAEDSFLISTGSGSNDNQFNQPAGILDENENLYVADLYNHRVKKIQTGLQIKIRRWAYRRNFHRNLILLMKMIRRYC